MILSEEVNNFIRLNLKTPDKLLSELEVYAKDNYVPISKPETAAFLRTICAAKRPERILEAGTAIGYSSIIMAKYLEEGGKIDTVEIDEDIAYTARNNIEKAGYADRINVIIGNASDVFSCIDKRYDIVFLDAAKGQYKQIYDDAKRVLNIGGYLISDNILFDGRVAKEGAAGRKFRTIVVNMRDYINRLTGDECFETSLLTVGDGLAFSVKIKE